MPARQETINEVSFFWRPMLARPVTNGNVFVFGMKDTAEIECEQANGNLWPEFFPLDLFDLRFSVTISFIRFSRLLDFIEWKIDFRLRSDFRK